MHHFFRFQQGSRPFAQKITVECSAALQNPKEYSEYHQIPLPRHAVSYGQLSNSFKVKMGAKQGWILFLILFTLAVTWLMTKTTKNCGRGISWTLTSVLEDLDNADKLHQLPITL